MNLGRLCAEGRAVPHRHLAIAVVVLYGLLVAGYALRTPAWQIPDEPAHYNYVERVARAPLSPPVLEPGDYPKDRLDALASARVSPPGDIAGIEYEDHQPPLYYYLASMAYRLAPDTEGRRSAIRLLGALFGAMGLFAVWRIGRLAVPYEPAVAVGAMAFVAFLPMNLTMTGAVNNDALATPLAALILLVTLQRSTGRTSRSRFVASAGALFALALLTKATLYPLAASVLVGGLLGERRTRLAALDTTPQIQYATPYRSGIPPQRQTRGVLWGALGPLVVGALVALPWFVRNALVYGANDPLVLRTHDEVVVGQERTADWIALNGFAETAERLIVFTFESFWGVFGWMGVFLAPWAYGLMALSSCAALVGLLLAVRRVRGEGRTMDAEVVLPLGVAFWIVTLAFLFYNWTFVQHQGRYFFPALAPIALAMSFGLFELGAWTARRADRPQWARCVGGATVYTGVGALAMLAYLAMDRYVALPTP